MSSFSDEPVLVKPTAHNSWKRWLAIVIALGVVAAVCYVPYDKSRMEKLSHNAKRGSRQGAVYPVSLEGVSHTIELTWGPDGQFAPTLDPAPAADTTLRLESRPGSETLSWNAEKGCFGPTTFGNVDPFRSYKLALRLERQGRVLWRDSLWAFGVHDTHGHDH